MQRYTVANDPTVGNDFAMPRTLRVCNIMKYMPQVVTDRVLTPAFCIKGGVRHDAVAPILPQVQAA